MYRCIRENGAAVGRKWPAVTRTCRNVDITFCYHKGTLSSGRELDATAGTRRSEQSVFILSRVNRVEDGDGSRP
jgi:hypothetical protein